VKLVPLQPLTGVSLLLLPSDLGLERLRLGGVGGNPGDSFPPETDIDSGCAMKVCDEWRVVFPGRESQLEQRIAGIGLDLRGQHTRGCPPGLTGVGAPFDYQYL
jgi:hypothetical protein